MYITVKKAKKKYNLTGEEYCAAKNWDDLSCLPLPEELIREAADKVDWYEISKYSRLSENFIEEFKSWVYWDNVSMYQKLSENFIRKFKYRVNWNCISVYQKLSEDFIREFQDKVNWFCISEYQKLSEDFIREFQDKVDWRCISKYQPLSEGFILKFKDKVIWYFISRYQVVSKEFLAEFGFELFGMKLYNNSDKPASYWKREVQETGLYECYEDFFYAYKGIRSDRYSAFNFQYRYLPGETYECFSDYSDDENSFGLSVWTKEEAEGYCNELVVKVKVYYKDVTAVIYDYSENAKIRCKQLTVLE